MADQSHNNNVSTRMSAMLDAVLSGMPQENHGLTSSGLVPVDLSVSENWLLRPELLQICKESIAQDLTANVSSQIFLLNRCQ